MRWPANVWTAYSMCCAPAASGSLDLCTVHDRFQEWRRAGVFEKLWQAGLVEYDRASGFGVGMASDGWGHDQGREQALILPTVVKREPNGSC